MHPLRYDPLTFLLTYTGPTMTLQCTVHRFIAGPVFDASPLPDPWEAIDQLLEEVTGANRKILVAMEADMYLHKHSIMARHLRAEQIRLLGEIKELEARIVNREADLATIVVELDQLCKQSGPATKCNGTA